jgi:hypothetical protein
VNVVSVEDEFSILFGYVYLILVGVEDFDAVLSPLGERQAVPGYSCEPSVRGSGFPAQLGISIFVRRGLSPGFTKRNLISCIVDSARMPAA